MPVPAPMPFSSSQVFQISKKQGHHHHSHHRAALAPVPKSGNTSAHSRLYSFDNGEEQIPSLPPMPTMMMMDYGHGYRRSGTNDAADENMPYTNLPAAGVSLKDKGTFHHSRSQSSLPSTTYRHDREARRSLIMSSWPPSPEGLPPTPGPKFIDNNESDASYYGRHADTADGAYQASPSLQFSPFVPQDAEEEEEIDIGLSGSDVYSPTHSESGYSRSGPALSPADIEAAASKLIGQLVPSPSELLKNANEQARANAATFLSDWISEAIWEISLPLMNVYKSGHMRRSSTGGYSNFKATAPAAFKRFAQQTIYQVSASSGSLILALWYIHRLPIHADEWVELRGGHDAAFREDLFSIPSEIPWRLLVLGLTLSNKWLEDNTFTTKTWHEVTGLSIQSMRTIETKAIAIFDWKLSPHPDEWLEFLTELRRRELHASHVSAIGSERYSRSFAMASPGSNKRSTKVIDELIADVKLVKVEFDPVFPGDAAALLAEASPSSIISEMMPLTPSSPLLDSFGAEPAVDQTHAHPRPPPPGPTPWSLDSADTTRYNSRPLSWSVSELLSSAPDSSANVSSMRHSLSIPEETFRPRAQQQESYRPSFHPYQLPQHQPVRRIKTPAA